MKVPCPIDNCTEMVPLEEIIDHIIAHDEPHFSADCWCGEFACSWPGDAKVLKSKFILHLMDQPCLMEHYFNAKLGVLNAQ